MCLELSAGKAIVRIRQSTDKDLYKPSVDITYKSVSEAYGDAVLAIILTGMGSDGREGAIQLKKRGSAVWAQDEGSSVVYGMPQAIIEAGLADRVLPLTEMADQLVAGA
jgi:two-component system chemotaxis response regulator CheB